MAKTNNPIIIASDHNGNDLRDHLTGHMWHRGICCIDIGPVHPFKKVDYVDYAQQVAYAVSENGDTLRGVLICGTGIGMSIVANRFQDVRASMVTDIETAHKTREHNDSNVLVLGAWKASLNDQLEIFDAWYDQEFGKGRHIPRVSKIDPKNSINLVPGVFDVLKPSHIDLLEFAKNYGRVVVALADQPTARTLKGSTCRNFEARKKILQSVVFVDEIIESKGDDIGELCTKVGASYVTKGDRAPEIVVRATDHILDHVQVMLFPIQEIA